MKNLNDRKKWSSKVGLYRVFEYDRSRFFDRMADKLCQVSTKESGRCNNTRCRLTNIAQNAAAAATQAAMSAAVCRKMARITGGSTGSTLRSVMLPLTNRFFHRYLSALEHREPR